MAAKDLNSSDSRLKNYRDEAGLSTRRLEAGLWYVRHRKLFIFLIIFILGATALGTLGFSLYKFGHYYFVERQQQQQNFLELTSGTSLITNKSNAAGNLSYSEVRVLPGVDNSSDIIAAVTNTNTRSIINFSYYFDVNGTKVGAGSDFVFPGDTKYLMAFKQNVPANAFANLIIENFAFKRVDLHTVGNWEQYQSDRLNFQIENAVFAAAPQSGLSEKISLGELSFKITNKSGFGYKAADLDILLKSAGTIAAVNRHRLENFRSGESRTIRISWPGRLPTIDQVDIVPDVNILDEGVYLKYSTTAPSKS